MYSRRVAFAWALVAGLASGACSSSSGGAASLPDASGLGTSPLPPITTGVDAGLDHASPTLGHDGAVDGQTAFDAGVDATSHDSGTPKDAQVDVTSLGDASSDASTNGDAATDAAGDAGTTDAGPPSNTTTIRFHYPVGSHTLTIRGDTAPLNWNSGMPLTAGPDDTFTATLTGLTAPVQCKPLLDDATWSLGPNYTVPAGTSVDLYPRFTNTNGTWSVAFQWTSTILDTTRGIYVYLPPSYAENTLASFPVVYMHDGQNLFDPAASFAGVTWQIQNAMDDGAADGSITEAIVIGVDNDSNRIAEYTPVTDPTTDEGGAALGDEYLQALITELKPQIDASYRTLPDRAHTFMMGSSLGGLITAYAGVEHADVYGAVGILSPSTWWDNEWIDGIVGTIPQKSTRAIRVYLDSGNAGDGNDDVTLTAALDQDYLNVGYVEGTSLDYLVQDGGQHSETYWAERAPGALSFVVGPRTP